ncbi:MAG: SOS response-associated peptidase [Rhodospirillaceae bacterium]|nr:SOS response-associated peptidase [Rhodospirillaceae bacterium]
MCGRYSITTAPEAIRRLFDVNDRVNVEPRYNLAPLQMAPVIRTRDGARHLDMLRWGLVPKWAKDETMASRMINARSETVTVKPSFRSAFSRRRCLVPSDGFYEWRVIDDVKQPYRICLRDSDLFAFAGLWESWQRPNEPEEPLVETFTILTIDATPEIAHIHPRMPVMLAASEDHDTWLTGTDQEATDLLRPFQGEGLATYEISTRVGNVRNDDADIIEPLAGLAQPRQPRLL